MTKICIQYLFQDKRQQNSFLRYSATHSQWFVWTPEGVYYYDTEIEANIQKSKLKDSGIVQVSVHHTKDIIK